MVLFALLLIGDDGVFQADKLQDGRYRFQVRITDEITGATSILQTSFRVTSRPGFCDVVPINRPVTEGGKVTVTWVTYGGGNPTTFRCSLNNETQFNCKYM